MAKVSEKKKVELLETAVLSGDIEAVKKVIETYREFEFTARAFGLACLYTNVKMVRVLAENGMTFRYSNDALSRYKAGKKVDCYFYSANYALLLACTDKTFWEDYHFGILPEITERVNDSVARLEILEFLLQKPAYYDMNLSELLYYAVLWRNEAVVEKLMNHGISLQTKAYWLESTEKSWRRNELNAAFQTMSEESIVYLLQTFGTLMKQVGKKVAVTQGMVEYDSVGGKKINHTFLQPSVLKVILDTADTAKLKKTDVLEILVCEENIPSLELLVNAGWLKTTPQKEKLIQYATENHKTAALAWLMDYIAKTTDPVKEHAKETTKIRRAMSERVSTTAEVKKLWNYVKQEDGTLVITGYKGSETDIQVPAQIGKNRVTAIGPRAFDPYAPRIRNGYERNFISRIVVPEGIVRIEWYAFSSLRELTEVHLPKSAEIIDDSAFSYSDKVTIYAPAHSEAVFHAVKKGIPCVRG